VALNIAAPWAISGGHACAASPIIADLSAVYFSITDACAA
jgi:hypothetical protein